MEDLPCEIVRYIFSFLTIDDRFRLRRVSRTFKTITEFHLKYVKRVTSHRRQVYNPLHAGCKFTEQEFCASAFRPECLLLILKYCTSIECLFIGKIPLGSDHLVGIGKQPIFKTTEQLKPYMGIDRKWADESTISKLWTESSLTEAFDLMTRMDSLSCLSWIGLDVKIPQTLKSRLTHIFCPIIFDWYGRQHEVSDEFLNDISVREYYTQFTVGERSENRVANLHDRDYSDLIFVNNRYLFFERHSVDPEVRENQYANDQFCYWNIILRTPAGEADCEMVAFDWTGGEGIPFTIRILPADSRETTGVSRIIAFVKRNRDVVRSAQNMSIEMRMYDKPRN